MRGKQSEIVCQIVQTSLKIWKCFGFLHQEMRIDEGKTENYMFPTTALYVL